MKPRHCSVRRNSDSSVASAATSPLPSESSAGISPTSHMAARVEQVRTAARRTGACGSGDTRRTLRDALRVTHHVAKATSLSADMERRSVKGPGTYKNASFCTFTFDLRSKTSCPGMH